MLAKLEAGKAYRHTGTAGVFEVLAIDLERDVITGELVTKVKTRLLECLGSKVEPPRVLTHAAGNVAVWWDHLEELPEGDQEHLCDLYGHAIRDCSSAGPDSGDMDHECERCGRYWSVPLY